MILFQLQCADAHRFEAWFRDGAAFDAQSANGKIDCPFCGATQVTKAPMAPHLGKRRSRNESAEKRAQEVAKQILKAVGRLRHHVERNCDYVGGNFAEEARRIHYGESEERGIYGETSDSEAVDLEDEGIEFQRIPWLPRRDN